MTTAMNMATDIADAATAGAINSLRQKNIAGGVSKFNILAHRLGFRPDGEGAVIGMFYAVFIISHTQDFSNFATHFFTHLHMGKTCITKILLTALICFATAIATHAQHLTWSLDFGSVFDNREGDNSITDTKTFFFTNLAPEIGVQFTKRDRISGGVVWNQPIGNEWDGYRISPTLYYRHQGRRWSASMGMFPRTQLHQPLPGFLWCDSLTYFQRNIRGFLVQYNSRNAFIDFYLDWRQLQTATKREAFNIVFHGEWRPRGRSFLIGGHAMMNHFALTRHAPANQHIVDNFLANPYVGIDLKQASGLDSLVIKGGALITIERNRANNEWRMPAGAWIEITGEWKWLGLRNSFYAGGRLFPSYSELGAELYQGEPFYQSDLYNRTDIYARIIGNEYVNLEASLDFNITKDSFIFYQRLMLRVYLDNFNCPFGKKKKSKSRSILANTYL